MAATDRPAFVTGSHAYGTPNGDSDIDVVIFADAETQAKLVDVLGRVRSNYMGSVTEVKSGSVHLIVCRDAKDYDAWKLGTQICKDIAPVDKDAAAKILNRVRAGFNV